MVAELIWGVFFGGGCVWLICLFDCVERYFQQYLSYIVAVGFIGGGNRRKPPICCTITATTTP